MTSLMYVLLPAYTTVAVICGAMAPTPLVRSTFVLGAAFGGLFTATFLFQQGVWTVPTPPEHTANKSELVQNSAKQDAAE